MAAGPLDEALSAQTLSACFGLAVTLERRGNRFVALASGI
jgi:hypothetical protein